MKKTKETNFKHIQNPVKHPRQSFRKNTQQPWLLAIFANSTSKYLTML